VASIAADVGEKNMINKLLAIHNLMSTCNLGSYLFFKSFYMKNRQKLMSPLLPTTTVYISTMGN